MRKLTGKMNLNQPTQCTALTIHKEKVAAVLDYLNEFYSKEQVCQCGLIWIFFICTIDVNYFVRLFKSRVGMTPSALSWRIKLEFHHAIKLSFNISFFDVFSFVKIFFTLCQGNFNFGKPPGTDKDA